MPVPAERGSRARASAYLACHQAIAAALFLGTCPCQCSLGFNSTGTASVCSAICSRSEEHTSELQSLMRISYAVFCLKKKRNITEDKYHFIQYNATSLTHI